MFFDRFRYELQLMGKRVILTPLLVMVGFALFAGLLHYLKVEPARILSASGGMKRRIGIAQALLNDPKLLIVHEPISSLDPEERIRFRNLLSEKAGDRTVLLSTHIVEDIAQTCRNLAVMKNGHIVFQGTTADLLQEARGKVWMVTSTGAKPEGRLTVISTMHMGTSVQYRVVGNSQHRMGQCQRSRASRMATSG